MKNTLFKPFIVASTLAFLAACSDMGAGDQASGNGDSTDIKTLIQQAEDARAEADRLGFEWSVTAPLLEEAHAAYKAGNEEQARMLFDEAKHQSMLAIEQAHYAEKHWQLLVPAK